MFIFSFMDRAKLGRPQSTDSKVGDNFADNSKDPEFLLKRMFEGDENRNMNNFNGEDYERVKNYVRWGDPLSEAYMIMYNLDGQNGVDEKDLWLLDEKLKQLYVERHYKANSTNPGDVTGDNKVDYKDLTILSVISDALLGTNPYMAANSIDKELIKKLDLSGANGIPDGLLNGYDVKQMENLFTRNGDGDSGRPPDPSEGLPGRPADPNVLLGDLIGANGQGDGKVDFRDVEILAQALNQDPRNFHLNNFLNADMNHDGKVNWSDLRELVSKARETSMNIDVTAPGGEGDINGDGKFDKGDLDTMSYASDFAALGELTKQEKTFLDITGDGEVDAKDYHAMYAMLNIPKIDLDKIKGSPSINSDKWFVSQNLGFNNVKEKEDRNSNCQAASFSMAMIALGEWEGGAERAADLVEAARYCMGATGSNYEGIIAEKVKQGAEKLGLKANLVDVSLQNKDADIQKMKDALLQGHKIIAGVNPALYAAVYDSGHAICLNGFNEATGKFIIGDPGFDVPIELDPELLLKAIEARRGKITIIEKRGTAT